MEQHEIRMPDPSGPYRVGYYDGVVSYETEGGSRQFGYRCFYPAEAVKGQPAMYYADREMLDMHLQIPPFGAFEPLLKHFTELPTHSYEQAPFAAGLPGCPVIVYSHGYSSFAWSNLIQQEELASRGYVVFALAHPGDAFCAQLGDERIGLDLERKATSDAEAMSFAMATGLTTAKSLSAAEAAAYIDSNVTLGAIVEEWTLDTAAAMDEIQRIKDSAGHLLFDKLDCSGFGLFGHSLGGAASLNTALSDQRVRAAVNLDGWQFGGSLKARKLPVPGLVLSPGANHLAGNYRPDDANLTYVIVPDSTHLLFSDLSVNCGEAIKLADPEARIDGHIMSQLTTDFVVGFFELHLKQQSSVSLQQIAGRYSAEVTLLANTALL